MTRDERIRRGRGRGVEVPFENEFFDNSSTSLSSFINLLSLCSFFSKVKLHPRVEVELKLR